MGDTIATLFLIMFFHTHAKAVKIRTCVPIVGKVAIWNTKVKEILVGIERCKHKLITFVVHNMA